MMEEHFPKTLTASRRLNRNLHEYRTLFVTPFECIKISFVVTTVTILFWKGIGALLFAW